MTSTPELPLFIGGRATPSASQDRFANINPATGEVLAMVHEADKRDVDAAVVAAQAGFREWSALPGMARGRVLLRAAALMRERRDELAETEVRDTGKPISETPFADVDSAIDALEFYGGLAADIKGDHLDLGSTAFAYTRREPLGVCVGIGAWNYPLQIAAWKSAPALATGNAMIFKPSELTPTNAMKLAEIYQQAGLPDGVFNVVHGRSETGHLLASHPGVNKISFTGSVPTGRKVFGDAAAGLKQATLELGGKSPLIIFSDAQLSNAVSAAMNANFYSMGEVCSNGTRVFVHEDLHADFMALLKARTEAMTIGDPMDPTTRVGPLISKAHRDRVLEYVRLGIEEGAYLVTGGEPVNVPGFEDGNFVSPAIFDACQDDMRICKEEIFGPVMSVLTFREEEEVVERANATEFGLAAGVFTQNLTLAHRVVARLQAGSCWINNYNLTPAGVPFGGIRQSGIGRENCRETLDHFTQVKSVYVELGDVECDY
ncbi:betaine-aldehyde dehydrogenase [Sneathiella chinensis]|uniref:NAD/NADP-dependent betaine aldehyde dehydrogenase n=1 Tax=Sneathiella chinensis TaxID=349750 RepID=A0ABQ5U480_9PROT|nr:betaine-aldehyde dehydrogenase [Sneathiella chinensis]GLQ06719.1 NAD/NADP-dependent betaine aldehyde dehydrogenase [Sneathiella chinensis]